MSQDSGLVKRGIGLLAVMTLLVVLLLTLMFYRNPTPLPTAAARPELHAASLVRGDASFPAAVSWLGLFQVGEIMPSPLGWEIRYNAAQALARRGSDQVPWDTIREMLDEGQQLRNFRATLQDGRNVPDESAARGTLLIALKSVADWHKAMPETATKRIPSGLPEVYAAIDKLASHPIMEIKLQAENTRQLFLR